MTRVKVKYLMRKLRKLSRLKTVIKMKKNRKHFSFVREQADADC